MATELPSTSTTYEAAHEVYKGDPRIDGPYLDDIRQAQEDGNRQQRMDALRALAKSKAPNPGSEEAATEPEEEKGDRQRLNEDLANLKNPNQMVVTHPKYRPDNDVAEDVAQNHFAADTYREKDEQDPLIPNDATPLTLNKQRDKKLSSIQASEEVTEGTEETIDESDVPVRTTKNKPDEEKAVEGTAKTKKVAPSPVAKTSEEAAEKASPVAASKSTQKKG